MRYGYIYIFIYFSADPNVERDFVEEKLEEILEGKGEVTGGGAGIDGANIDIELRRVAEMKKPLKLLKQN